MKNLILVESPTKARTLTRFLAGKYNIEASFGHVRDLPKGDLGVDIEKDFTPKYVIPSAKRKTVEELKRKAKDADKIILATDPDREGEAISYHLYEILKKVVGKKVDFQRIVFHEITPGAINEALEHPRKIDQNLVSAQTARRVLDRIVGYKLSPILWKKVQRRLSAGRVQSIALRLIVEREKEIGKFQKNEYLRAFVTLSKKGEKETEFELTLIDHKPLEAQNKLSLYDGDYNYKSTTLSKKEAEELDKILKEKIFKVTKVTEKETKRSPSPPYTTSVLQQDAFRRLGYTSKRTMSIAQRLYEEGFITYHRTDSFNLSDTFVKDARENIEKTFGEKYIPEIPRFYKTKSKLAQEAHEAIRPTSSKDQGFEVVVMGKDFAKLYDLIYKRSLASQMSDAIFDSIKAEVEASNGKTYHFEANGKALKFPGFLKIWFYEDDEQLIPVYKDGENLIFNNFHFTTHETSPPPRYNEASLISSLEKHGIGRPSTYAPIISTIQEREYVDKEEGRFQPTNIGNVVSDFLVKNFSEIDDIPFTASMENSLDEIAEGKKEWVPMIRDFYKPFEETLKKAESQEHVEVKLETTGKKCPECGGDIVVRRSRFGKFYACSNFPKCTYKESFSEETEFVCPKDSGKVIIKRTRRGRPFFGCSNYPKCDFAVWNRVELLKTQPQKEERTPEDLTNVKSSDHN